MALREQIKVKEKMSSYKEVEEKAMDLEKWRNPHRQENDSYSMQNIERLMTTERSENCYCIILNKQYLKIFNRYCFQLQKKGTHKVFKVLN